MALEPETLYKLIIMHMLNKVDFPLTNTQIAQFFLENEYTTYFSVQRSINELIENGFVFLNVNRNTSYYHLTSEGRESLKFFENKIPNQIVDDVDMFLIENKYELRNEAGTVSDYYRAANGDYIVHCQVKEGLRPVKVYGQSVARSCRIFCYQQSVVIVAPDNSLFVVEI